MAVRRKDVVRDLRVSVVTVSKDLRANTDTGASLNFVWMMAAHREVVDRRWGVVHTDARYPEGF